MTTSGPPPIAGVRRSLVEARGVRFHVTEAGPADGRPVLALVGGARDGERRRLHAGKVDATRFIIEEQPDLVRARLISLAEETCR